MEKYTGVIIWGIGTLVAVLTSFFKLKSDVKTVETKLDLHIREFSEKMTKHIDDSEESDASIKKNINILYERERENTKDLSSLKSDMKTLLKTTERILNKLDNNSK